MLKAIKVQGPPQSGRSMLGINWLNNATMSNPFRAQGIMVLPDQEKVEFATRHTYAAILFAAESRMRVMSAKTYLNWVKNAMCINDTAVRQETLNQRISVVLLDDADAFDPDDLAAIFENVQKAATMLSGSGLPDPMLMTILK